MRKSVFGVSDQAQHKPVCTAIEDGQRLKNSDFGNRGLELNYTFSENKGADQLRGYSAADLRL